MKVYITYEFSDYGLWDMSSARVFKDREDAEAYSREYYEAHGWGLDIAEFEVE